jgi:hypothetical protein
MRCMLSGNYCDVSSAQTRRDFAYNWKPSISMIAIVPSCATHKRDPFSLPTVSPLGEITWTRGVLNKVQRAHILRVLSGCQETRELFHQERAYPADQNAMLPSSAPPAISLSLVRSSSIGNKVVIGPRRGTSDVISAGEDEDRRKSDVVWMYPSP